MIEEVEQASEDGERRERSRAARREHAHESLRTELRQRLAAAEGLPLELVTRLDEALERSVRLVEQAAQAGESGERQARQAASALYHASAAVVMATEGAALGAGGGDARRVLLARLVFEYKLSARDPLMFEPRIDEATLAVRLLSDEPVMMESLHFL